MNDPTKYEMEQRATVHDERPVSTHFIFFLESALIRIVGVHTGGSGTNQSWGQRTG